MHIKSLRWLNGWIKSPVSRRKIASSPHPVSKNSKLRRSSSALFSSGHSANPGSLEAAVPNTTNDEAAQGDFPSSSKAAKPKAFSVALSSNAVR